MNVEDIRDRLLKVKLPAINAEDYATQRTKWDKAQQYLAEITALDKSFSFESIEITIIESENISDFFKKLKELGPYYTDMNNNKFCKIGVVHTAHETYTFMWCFPISAL